MRSSQFFLCTLRETPADAEVVSHRLMLRAGMIRRLSSGLYSWLPLGLRVLKRVETIVREEMNRAGALELCMPVVQPAELWQESGRWEQYGPELLRLADRHERDFCLGPTHEEVITDIVRNEIGSYKQLPINLYQIQTKFRDEVRPRFGIMRSREFIMKDAYSFHTSAASLQEGYDIMYRAYCAIFERLGLDYRAVIADNGSIGGTSSHEFHVLADSGEDRIAFSDSSDYAANVELARSAPPPERPDASGAALEEVATPDAGTIEAVAKMLGVGEARCVKTLIVRGSEPDRPVALVLRGDHRLSAVKAERLPGIAAPLTFIPEEQIRALAGAGAGSIGPVGLQARVVVDPEAAALADFVCGANRDGFHLRNVNWGRDAGEPEVADLREVCSGDPSPDGRGSLRIKRGIEVGHVFQLGTKYSEAMKATVLDADGKSVVLHMGCYGIGVTRIVAAAIEQNHDEQGIIWPAALAPFQVAIVPINPGKSEAVADWTETIYRECLDAGIDVLLDDREERPGVRFADMELIGIPHRIVIGDRALAEGEIEYRARSSSESERIRVDSAVALLKDRLATI